jgi:hypothetical protein
VLDELDTTTLRWAVDTVGAAVDRGARFVLPAVLELDDAVVRAAVRMTLTLPTPAIVEGAPDPSAASPSGPPPSIASDAVTYLAVWVVGASLVVAARRLPVDDPFAVELREVQALVRRAVRAA